MCLLMGNAVGLLSAGLAVGLAVGLLSAGLAVGLAVGLLSARLAAGDIAPCTDLCPGRRRLDFRVTVSPPVLWRPKAA